MARFIYDHAFASRLLERSVALGNWALRNPALLLFIAGLLALAAAARKHVRMRTISTAAGLVIAFAMIVAPASALSTLTTLTEYVEASDYVVHGTVESTNSYWTFDGKRIVTDVTLKVEDSVKGRVNKGGLVHFQLPTGQVGAVVRMSPQLPVFSEGEEIVLFLRDRGGAGLGVVGGKRGKFIVKETPSETKYVGVMAPPPNPHLRQAAAEIKALRVARSAESDTAEAPDDGAVSDEKAADDGPITLEEFKDYIRYLDRELRKERR